MRGLSRRCLIFLSLLACANQSHRVVPLTPAGTGSLPTHSWVVLKGGLRVPVENGIFTRDSIVGFQDAGKRFSVSRDSVAFVEHRQVSTTSPAIGALKVFGYAALGALLILTLAAGVLLSELE